MSVLKCFPLVLILGVLPVSARTPLVILHTNDTHSQLEPFLALSDQYPGLGGILRREAYVRSVRAEEPNVLLVEAGDFVQGTAYFNFFKGEAEVQLMNFLNLDAITLGNHEFDNGIEALAFMLKKATFPVVCTNYDLSKTPLKDIVKPWAVVKRGKLLIGIVGANIDLKGFTMASNAENVVYLDPIKAVESRAAWLKEKKKCDVVVCLSHLGYENKNGKVDDLTLAAKSKNIDVIIGGHSHTMLNAPILKTNLNGDTVVINQVGKWGAYMGRINLEVGK